jgi:tRNA (guanine-N7-)-methyltransferase
MQGSQYEAALAKVLARKATLSGILADWADEQPGSVVLELGCGHGHFLTAYAAAHPKTQCLGVDLMGARLARADKKKARLGLANLNFLKAEAGELLEAWPSGVAIDKVYLLFLDPWPKRRHHKNRLVQAEFLTRLSGLMASEGELFFRTDHLEYFEWAKAHVAKHPSWDLMLDASWGFEMKTVFQSKAQAYHSFVARCHPLSP